MRGRRPGHGHDRGTSELTKPQPGAGAVDRLRTGPTGLALRWLNSDGGRGFRALRHRPFRRLFSGFVVQQLGFWTSHLTLQGVVDDITDNDPVAMSLLFAALLAPVLLLSPFAGVLADRRDRRLIMVKSYASMGLTAAGLAAMAALWDAPPLAVVYPLAVLLGVGFALLSPAIGAAVADAVSADDLNSAISLQAAATNLTRVGGPMLAGGLIAASFYSAAFAAFAVTCAFAAAVLTQTRLRPYERDPAPASVLGRLRDGLSHARERPPALRALRTVAVTAVFGVAQVAMLPAFTSLVLKGAPGQFALLAAGSGLGAIAGAMALGYSRRPVTLASGARAQLLYGLVLTGFALSGGLAEGFAWQVAAGMLYFLTMTRMQALLQLLADDAKRARLMSLFSLCWGGIMWVGTVIMGLAAGPAGLGLRTTLLLASGVCAVHGAWTLISAGVSGEH